MDFETRAIHVGQEPDAATGAVIVPIYQTSTYAQDEVGVHKGLRLLAHREPDAHALEECLASLEGAATGSRSPPVWARSPTGPPPALAGRPGRLRRTTSTAARTGSSRRSTSRRATASTSCRSRRSTRVSRSVLDERTRMVWVESPTNPLLQRRRHRRGRRAAPPAGALCVVDNTFATPYLQRPLELWRRPRRALDDEVPRRALRRHRRLRRDERRARSRNGWRFSRTRSARSRAPFDAWLVLRGLKTLALRMRQHCANAGRIARGSPNTRRSSASTIRASPHPQHELAHRQMTDFGGMVSLRASRRRSGARAVVAATRIWQLGESLGGVESLIELPGLMTHASLAELAVRAARKPRPALGRDRVRRRPDRRPRAGARRVGAGLRPADVAAQRGRRTRARRAGAAAETRRSRPHGRKAGVRLHRGGAAGSVDVEPEGVGVHAADRRRARRRARARPDAPARSDRPPGRA